MINVNGSQVPHLMLIKTEMVGQCGSVVTSVTPSMFFSKSPGFFLFTVSLKQWIQRCIWKDSATGNHQTADRYAYLQRDTNLLSQSSNNTIRKILFFFFRKTDIFKLVFCIERRVEFIGKQGAEENIWKNWQGDGEIFMVLIRCFINCTLHSHGD